MEIGEKVVSPSFKFRGKQWEISLFPNGCSQITKENMMSIYFYLIDPVKLPFKLEQWSFLIEGITFSDSYASEFSSDKCSCGKGLHYSRLTNAFKLGHLITGLKIKDKKFKVDGYIPPINQKLFDNSKNGDFTIKCRDDQSVRADKFILVHEPYFKAVIDFKQSQSSEDSVASINEESEIGSKSTDLSNFSAESVNLLLEFIYTGKISLPYSADLYCQLYILADFTTNQDLIELLIKEIKIILKPDTVLDYLICMRGRPVHLPLTKLVIKYFRENKVEIAKTGDYNLKHDLLFDTEFELDLVKELMR